MLLRRRLTVLVPVVVSVLVPTRALVLGYLQLRQLRTSFRRACLLQWITLLSAQT